MLRPPALTTQCVPIVLLVSGLGMRSRMTKNEQPQQNGCSAIYCNSKGPSPHLQAFAFWVARAARLSAGMMLRERASNVCLTLSNKRAVRRRLSYCEEQSASGRSGVSGIGYDGLGLERD